MSLGRWAHLGHRLGECWVDETHHLTYVHVPKNASSFIKGCLIGCYGMWKHSETLVPADQYLIVLRDPIERWISGIAEYCHNSGNMMTVKQALTQVTFDDHTEHQVYFIQGVDLTKATFLRVDENLRANLEHWLKQFNYRTNIQIALEYNTSAGSKRDFINQFTEEINSNSIYRAKLEQYFADDYKLYNSVTFYDQ
jgi:hypothetical protein